MVAMLDTSPNPAGEPSRADGDALVFATLGAGLVLATAWTAFHLAPAPALPPASYDGTPIASLVDVTPLRRFHVTVLIGTAFVGAAGLLAPAFRKIVDSRAASLAAAALTVAFVPAIIVAACWLFPQPVSSMYLILFGEKYGLLTIWPPITYGIIGLASCCLALALLRFGSIPDHWTIWVVVLVYAGALAWPGSLLPLDLGRIAPGALQSIEWHYDVFFGAKNDLVRGVEPAGFGYGLGLSALSALVEKVFGPFSFAGDVRLVQVGNIAFSVVMLAACWLWFQGRALAALLAAVLVLPWIHNLHQNIFFPNQSGWRFIFFPIALLAFALARFGLGRRAHDAKVATAFGFIAGMAILWNPETGLAVLLGLSSYLVCRLPRLDIRSLLLAGALFLLGLVAAIGISSALYLAAFGHALPLARLAAAFVERLGGFPYGLPLSFDPLALVILSCAIGTVLAGAWLRRAGALTPAAAGAVGSGVIILVWAGYFLQRSSPWNLWGYLLPFSIIVGVAWSRPAPLRRNTSRAIRLATAAAALSVAFTIGPAILAGNIQLLASLDRAASPHAPAPHSGEYSGVRVPAADEAALRDRSAFLQAVPPGTLVFTGDSYLLPKHLGRRDLFWLPDPAFGRRHDGGATMPEMQAVIAGIRARSPALILFDEASAGGDDFHRKYFAVLQASIGARYRPDSRQSGWSLWRRIAP
jgi:hypothetical protein